MSSLQCQHCDDNIGKLQVKIRCAVLSQFSASITLSICHRYKCV